MESLPHPDVFGFFDTATYTVSYIVKDPASTHCAIIDPVLDFDPASGRTRNDSADQLIEFIQQRGWQVDWLLETHVHADHLSAAAYLQQQLGGEIAIGADVVTVQRTFAQLFNAEPEFATDGRQFQRLWHDGEQFSIGELTVEVMHTPGHTPACVSYRCGDAVFVGDTLFMPDYGTARCDFPGGDARELYHSIQRILSLPDETRIFLCHDYLPEGRTHYCWETTVANQKQRNIHVHQGVDEEEFVRARQTRDAQLAMPRLILPSVQINMRAGQLPPAEDNGVRYLKLPLNQL